MNSAAAAFETAVPGESITLTAAGQGAVTGGTSAGAAGTRALAVRLLDCVRCRHVVLCSAGPPPADSCANRATAALWTVLVTGIVTAGARGAEPARACPQGDTSAHTRVSKKEQ